MDVELHNSIEKTVFLKTESSPASLVYTPKRASPVEGLGSSHDSRMLKRSPTVFARTNQLMLSRVSGRSYFVRP